MPPENKTPTRAQTYRLSRRIALVFGGLCACFILTIFLAVAGLKTDWVQNHLLGYVNQAIPGTLSWKTCRFSLFRGSLAIQGLEVTGADGASLAKWDTLRLNLAWQDLLGGSLSLEEIYLRQPWVDLVIGPSGDINLVAAFVAPGNSPEPPKPDARPAPSQPVPPLNIRVQSLRLEDGEFALHMTEPFLETRLAGIALQAQADLLAQSAGIELAIQRGEVTYQGEDIRIDDVALRANWSQSKIMLDELRLTTDVLKADASGEIKDVWADIAPDLSLSLSADLADVRRVLKLAPELGGRVTAQLAMDGPLQNPDFELDATWQSPMITNITTGDIRLAAQMTDRQVRVDGLDAKIASGDLQLAGDISLAAAFADGFLDSEPQMEAVTYQVQLSAGKLRLAELPHSVKNLSGLLSGQLTLTGQGVLPEHLAAQSDFSLDIQGLTPEANMQPQNISLQGSAAMADQQVSLDHLHIVAGTLKADANGAMDLDGKHLRAGLELDAPDLKKALAPIGDMGISGQCQVSATVSGSLREPEMDLSMDAQKLGVKEFAIGDVHLLAGVGAGLKIHLKDLRLENQGSQVSGTGEVTVLPDRSPLAYPGALTLEFTDVEPGDFMANPPVKGVLSGNLDLTATENDIAGDLSLRGQHIRFQNFAAVDVDTRLKLRKDTLLVERLDFASGDSSLAAQGQLQVRSGSEFTFPKDPRFEIRIASQGLQLKDFASPYEGLFTLKADLAGTWSHPEGRVELSGTRIRTGYQDLDHVRVSADIENRRLDVNTCRIGLTPDLEVSAAGQVDLAARTLDLSLSSDPIELGAIQAIADLALGSGKAALSARARGTFTNPEVTAKVGLTDLLIKDLPMADTVLQASLTDHKLQATAVSDFMADARFDLETRDFKAACTFDRTTLTPYLKLTGLPQLTGFISGRIAASGNAGAPEAIGAEVVIKDAEVHLAENPLIATHDFKADFKNQKLVLSQARLDLLDQGHLILDGNLNLKGEYALRADGELPLKALGMLTDALPDITGTVTLALSGDGDISAPRLTGDIGLRQIGFSIPETDQKLHDLGGRIQIDPEEVRILAIDGKLEDGTIELQGKAALDKAMPRKIDLTLKTRNLPIQVPDTLEARLNSDLRFHGTPDKSLLSGDLVLLEGVYDKDINVNLLVLEDLTTKRRTASPPPQEPPDWPFIKNLALDLRVKRRSPFIVDNNLAYLEISPDLAVGGTLDQPEVSGRATVDTGEITFQKKTFVVTKGVVDFVNPYRIEPTLDIQSSVTIRDWVIYLTIAGTPDNLVFALRSEPPESDNDILSLLAFGKTSSELMEGEGGQSASPAQLAAGLIAETFGEKIGKSVGLDEVKVEYGDGADDPNQVKVTLGKNLSRRVRLKYDVISGDGELKQRTVAEYSILEYLLFDAFRDNQGEYGGELRYRLEFR